MKSLLLVDFWKREKVFAPFKVNYFNLLLLLTTIADRSDENPITVSSESGRFYELILNDLFIDKSRLLEDFLRPDNDLRIVRIVRPNGWGKSTNLDMIKRFLEVELDVNGNVLPLEKRINVKLFGGGQIVIKNRTKTLKPLNISLSRNTMMHLGQYPVITLDFNRITGKSFEEIVDKIKRSTINLFRRHRYLLIEKRRTLIEYVFGRRKPGVHVETDDRNNFKRFADGRFERTEIGYGLKLLSKLLFDRYRRAVFILIDNYDAPINRLFDIQSEKRLPEFRRLLEYFRSIFHSSFDDNHRVYRALLTGTFDFPFENVVTFNLLDERFSAGYGLTDDELNSTFSYDERDELRNRYGYNIDGRIRYNTQWIREFASNSSSDDNNNNNDTNNNNNRITKPTIVDNILRSDDMQKSLHDLTYGKTLKWPIVRTIDYASYAWCSESIRPSILLHAGYLNVRIYRNDTGDNNSYGSELTVANSRTRNAIEDYVANWTRDKFNVTNDFRTIGMLLAKCETKPLREVLEKILHRTNNDTIGVRNAYYYYCYYDAAMITLKRSLTRDGYASLWPESDFGRNDDRRMFVLIRESNERYNNAVIVAYSATETTEGIVQKTQNLLGDIHEVAVKNTRFERASRKRNVINVSKTAIVFCKKEFRIKCRVDRGKTR